MDYDAKLIAEHLTLIEEENLKRLRVKELVGLNWTKKEAEDLSPNVLVIVRHFNKMTSWVSTEILRKKSSRTQVIKKFIQIAQICLEMCNFSSLMVILSGLELTVITRLRRTWEEVKVKKCFKILEKIKNEFSLSSNYKNYRLLYQKCIENKKPFIPLLAVHLQDIVFIHEGNQDYTNKETETFNFEKITMFADSVHQLTLIQKRSYGLKVESPEFITDLVSCKTYTEKEAYEESLKIEPRKQN
uniref:Ras-GEF domain-containing protein n=1 Tax=Arcella intermedia TaxID=1963864 RepID=A0A6B2LFK3_9EUKA